MLANNTRINIGGSIVREVSDKSPVLHQGMALITVLEDGIAKVSQSTNTPAKFAGVAANVYKAIDRTTATEEFVATGTAYKLSHQAIAGAAYLYDITEGTSTAATMDADAQTVKDLTAAHAYKVVYAFVPSALDVMSSKVLKGNGLPGFEATEQVGSVSVITQGDVFTDMFDITKDWSTVSVKAGANGLFSDAGSDVNGYVVALPSANVPVLGIYFNV